MNSCGAVVAGLLSVVAVTGAEPGVRPEPLHGRYCLADGGQVGGSTLARAHEHHVNNHGQQAAATTDLPVNRHPSASRKWTCGKKEMDSGVLVRKAACLAECSPELH